MKHFPLYRNWHRAATGAAVVAILAVLACSMPPALADGSSSTAVFYVY